MQVFTDIYKQNYWRDDESVSGHGSTLDATETVRNLIPRVINSFGGLNSILDIPCGDFNWFQHIKGLENIQYIGADVVSELIYENQTKYPKVDFRTLDITKDDLPKVDLVLVRDLFGHFSNADIVAALKNLRASGSTYLLATTFPLRENVGDIETGQWRPLNLQKYFGLPTALDLFNENCKEGDGGFSDKSLGLWKIN